MSFPLVADSLYGLVARAGGGNSFDGSGSSGGAGFGGGSFAIFGGGGGIGIFVLIMLFSFALRRGGWRRGGPWGGGGGGGPWGGGGGTGGGGPSGVGRDRGPYPSSGTPSSPGDDPSGTASSPGAPPGGAGGLDAGNWMQDERPAAASIPGELFPEAHARAVQAASPVDVGLAAIKAHDPNFDLEQFTQQVQRVFFIVEEAWSEQKPEMSRQVMADGLWQQHRAQIQGYVDGRKRNMLDDLTVANVWPVAAHSDQQHDTLTVRLVAASADYDAEEGSGRVVRGDKEVKPWQEDWTFQRSSAAQTQIGGTQLGDKCPNCGAPLDVDLAGTCRYCKVSIMSGAYDWVLARISQVG